MDFLKSFFAKDKVNNKPKTNDALSFKEIEEIDNQVGTLLARDEPQEAWKILRKYPSSNPMVMLLAARIYTYQKDYSNGLISVEKVLEGIPNLTIAYALKGEIYLANKDFPQAINSLKQAAELDPSYAEVHFNLGLAYLQTNQLENALHAHNRGLQIDPNNERARGTRDIIIKHLGKSASNNETSPSKPLDDPINTLTKKIEADPRDVFALAERAEFYLLRKEFQLALRDIEECLELSLKLPKPYNNAVIKVLTKFYELKSTILAGLRREDESLQVIDELLQLNPNATGAYLQRARIYRERKSFQEALDEFSKVIQIDNKSDAAYLGRGITKANLLDYEGALADYDKVINLCNNPQEGDNPERVKQILVASWIKRGDLHLASNNLAQAEKDYSMAHKLNPQSKDVNDKISNLVHKKLTS